MKFFIHTLEISIGPGFWFCLIIWSILRFSMGFLEIDFPSIDINLMVTFTFTLISLENVFINNKLFRLFILEKIREQ